MPVPRCALVVDGSARARQRISALLTPAGWRVVEAAGVEAALRSAHRLTPDLVVTAAQLPDGSGVTLLRRLRQGGSPARFLALTSRPDAQVRAAVAALGGDCLDAPVDPRQLVELLRRRTPGPADQGTAGPLRVTSERLPVRPAAASPRPAGPPSAAAYGPGPGAARRHREEWVGRLPRHLARMHDSARAGGTGGVAGLSQPRLLQLVVLGPGVG